ncbi:MAG: glycosyltransferase [Gaiellaceae bacterium]
MGEPANSGPARARNRGARQAAGDVLVFVDSDVEVHADVFACIRRSFEEDRGLTAVFGSYDDRPEADGAVSAFRNLLHHHVHQRGAGRATTFWAGLGAVRRETFLATGGFDELRFPRPSVEDIELGMRLASDGNRILLDPLLQGTHLKRWTLAEMLRTDLLLRGAPWVALLLDGGSSSTALNLGWRQRASAGAALVLALALATRRPRGAVGASIVFVVLNAEFYALLQRRRGSRVAATGVLLHLLHQGIALASVPIGLGLYLRRRGLRA